MPKSKFFRVAVSGPTADNRDIDAKMIDEMAANYNTDTYAARINLEHIRGVTGQLPFTTLGDVIALKAEDVTIDVAGQPQKRRALYAQIDANQDLIDLNKKGQKLYTSIEIIPNFSKSDKAYLGGLAVTDSPASLATERLEFTKRANALGNPISDFVELSIDFEAEQSKTDTEVSGLFSALSKALDKFSGKTPEKQEAQNQVSQKPESQEHLNIIALATTISEGLSKIELAIANSDAKYASEIKAISDDMAAFKTQITNTPAATYLSRPIAAGGDGFDKASC